MTDPLRERLETAIETGDMKDVQDIARQALDERDALTARVAELERAIGERCVALCGDTLPRYGKHAPECLAPDVALRARTEGPSESVDSETSNP